jgi:hypothetical protein
MFLRNNEFVDTIFAYVKKNYNVTALLRDHNPKRDPFLRAITEVINKGPKHRDRLVNVCEEVITKLEYKQTSNVKTALDEDRKGVELMIACKNYYVIDKAFLLKHLS